MNEGCARRSGSTSQFSFVTPWSELLPSASGSSRSSCCPLLHSYFFPVHLLPWSQKETEREKMIISVKSGKHSLEVDWLLNKPKTPYLGIQSLHSMTHSLFPALPPYSFPPNSLRSCHSDLLYLPCMPSVFTDLCQNTLPPAFLHLTKFYCFLSASSALRVKVLTIPLFCLFLFQHILCYSIMPSLYLGMGMLGDRMGREWAGNGPGRLQADRNAKQL